MEFNVIKGFVIKDKSYVGNPLHIYVYMSGNNDIAIKKRTISTNLKKIKGFKVIRVFKNSTVFESKESFFIREKHLIQIIKELNK